MVLRKQITISILLLVGVLQSQVFAIGRLANQRKDGLRVFSIDRILRLEDEEIDIGTAALVLSRQWGTQKILYSYRNRIDDMAKAILREMAREHVGPDHRAIPIINKYLFEKKKFEAIRV